MGTITVTLPGDGTTADVSDYNTPINTIVNTINGNIDSTNISATAAIPNSALAGGITGDKLATSAIFLGYDATTGTNQTGITTEAAITDLSSTVTVPAGGRSVKITFSGQYFGGDVAQTALKCDGTAVKSGRFTSGSATSLQFTMVAYHTPAAGSHTYTASVTRITGAGSITLENSVAPCDILVELL
jgi:hypothetical protein